MPSNTKVLFKFGTKAQYLALDTKLENALYFLLDTGELYRGSVPFGQAHIYSGARLEEENNATCLARLVGANVLAENDMAVVTNLDNTVDNFIYHDNAWIQLNSHIESSTIAAMDTRVGDLETLLNGTPANEETGTPAIPGIVDRVTNLETAISGLTGALHFKGSVVDEAALEAILDPEEGDVYQLDDDEYAWNGSTWVKLGGQFDLSNYVTQADLADAVGDLEALIGTPASSHIETDPETGEPTTVLEPATGIYADLAANPGDIIPSFNGTTAGLVPVATGNLDNAAKANLFMNALGSWVNVNTSGGQTVYTDPENNTYSTVEEYVTYMLEHHEMEWSGIAD